MVYRLLDVGTVVLIHRQGEAFEVEFIRHLTVANRRLL